MTHPSPQVDPINRYRAALRLSATVPYGLGMRARGFAWSQRWLTHALFRRRVRDLRILFQAIPPGPDFATALRRHLECNLTMSWRLQALSRCSDAEFNRWVRIEGLEALQEILATGQGIVLANSHYGSGKTILLALARLGIEVHSFDRRNIFSMLGIKEAAHIHSIELGDKNNTFLLKQVAQARNVLKSGGILHIAADGFRGQSGIPREFLGRHRHFPTSFAELGIHSDAAVVPVFSPIDDAGHIHFRILPPLDAGQASDHAGKVSAMVDQYAALLAQHWCNDPGSVHENDLHIFGTLPKEASDLDQN